MPYQSICSWYCQEVREEKSEGKRGGEETRGRGGGGEIETLM